MTVREIPMIIIELLKSVSKLVKKREIINHRRIRCFLSQETIDDICDAEGIREDEVGTDKIGNDQLSQDLYDIIDSPHFLLYCDCQELIGALGSLRYNYMGEVVEDYLESEEDDGLENLESLIRSAENFVKIFP